MTTTPEQTTPFAFKTRFAPLYLLIEQAISAGSDPAVVQHIAALIDAEREASQRCALYSALSAFQAECPSIEKNSTANVMMKGGGTYSYNYAELGDIAEAIREPLGKHGLCYFWTSNPDGDGRLICKCSVRHVEGGSLAATFTAPTDTISKMSSQQAQASALTYAKRQSLVQALGLAMCDGDDDGAAHGSGKTLTEEQAAELDALIDAKGADRPAFLKYMGTENIRDIPMSRFQHAKRALEAKK